MATGASALNIDAKSEIRSISFITANCAVSPLATNRVRIVNRVITGARFQAAKNRALLSCTAAPSPQRNERRGSPRMIGVKIGTDPFLSTVPRGELHGHQRHYDTVFLVSIRAPAR